MNKPVVNLTSKDVDIRFVVIRACIRAATKAGWPYSQVQTFAARASGRPDYDTMMMYVREQFEVVVDP